MTTQGHKNHGGGQVFRRRVNGAPQGLIAVPSDDAEAGAGEGRRGGDDTTPIFV